MKLKNVLMVTYYWPPAAGPGVQRVLKFAKYLPEFGYNPIILTVENNQQLGIDESLLDDVAKSTRVYKTKIVFQRNNVAGKSFIEKKGGVNYFKRWIRGNILIPDAKIFWLFQSKKDIRRIFRENKVDVVFVSGPPQTSHLIGLWIKQKYRIPVVHDFRDPWTEAFFLKEFPRNILSTKIDLFLEKKVLRASDTITTVSKGLINILSNKVDLIRTKIISNGYDSEINSNPRKKIKEFVYTGTLSETAIPYKFLLALRKNNLKLRIFGSVHSELSVFINNNDLNNFISVELSVNHKKIIKIQQNADALFLTIPNISHNEGILTGKIFEYLAANRPIFAVAPENGDLATIIRKSGLGLTVDYDGNYDSKLSEFMTRGWQADITYIKRFHRKNLSSKLAKLFNDIL